MVEYEEYLAYLNAENTHTEKQKKLTETSIPLVQLMHPHKPKGITNHDCKL